MQKQAVTAAELASSSSSQHSCESKPKTPSEVHTSKKADAQKSSDDLSGMQIEMFSRNYADHRFKCKNKCLGSKCHTILV